MTSLISWIKSFFTRKEVKKVSEKLPENDPVKNKSNKIEIDEPVIFDEPENSAPDNQIRENIKTIKVSDLCLDLVKHFEHFYPKAYFCTSGVLTIGYGHTKAQGLPEFTKNAVWTEPFAMKVLRADLEETENYVRNSVNVNLFQYEFDAIVSFVFNIGVGAFRGSTFLRKLNLGKYDIAELCKEMHRWTKSGGKDQPGLIRRRKSESYLFKTGQLNFYE